MSCTPGFFFIIENRLGESIDLNFSIIDDLLDSSIEKTYQGRLENKEHLVVDFSSQAFFNIGIDREDYVNTEIFLSIFENIIIKTTDTDTTFNKNELSFFKVKHYRKNNANFYILVIEN